MPTLSPAILENLYYQILKDEGFQRLVYTLALAGQEALNVLEKVLSSTKAVCIDDDGLRITFERKVELHYDTMQNGIRHFLVTVGRGTNVLELEYTKSEIVRFAAPLISGVCEAKKLTKLTANHSSSISDLMRIVEACSSSLKVFQSDVTSYWCLDTQHLNLDVLHLYTLEHAEFRSIVKHKCCKTSTLSLGFLQHLDENSYEEEYLEWSTLINIFEGIQNPILDAINKLKLYVVLDGIDDDIRLEEVILNVSETFPALKALEIYENDSYSALEQISDMLFVVDGARLCFEILCDQIADSNYDFTVDVKWNIDFEGFFNENDCTLFIEKCKDVFDDFDTLDTDNRLTIRRTESFTEQRTLYFSVNVQKV